LIARWAPEVRLVAALTLVVALGAGALSWSALRAFAGAAHIDEHLTWIYPCVVDGQMAVGTVGAVVLRSAPLRTRAYVWSLVGASIAVSVAGNAAHASGAVLPPVAAALVSAVPAGALAASLHLLVMIVRGAPSRTGAVDNRARSRPAAGARTKRAPRAAPKVPWEGRMVSAGHMRKLRAAQRAEAAA
jgi:hypothetical protein